MLGLAGSHPELVEGTSEPTWNGIPVMVAGGVTSSAVGHGDPVPRRLRFTAK
ncbi:hypothetical protein IMPR6_480029 [Imperialibacter sp. EC-SDR9]|nr:hypothetical protein IMPERIA89_420033 [Imperialibacter sp. 89]CAD5295325.1 hypothetical protein IMPERIA75_690032 [Imperialibacter sp. 75]VVT29200.1 hypothetical protein IMPR6_480029 [Imperialibacter sp. EC-SDR9]